MSFVIMLSVVMSIVIMLRVVMSIVIMLSVVMLSVVLPNNDWVIKTITSNISLSSPILDSLGLIIIAKVTN